MWLATNPAYILLFIVNWDRHQLPRGPEFKSSLLIQPLITTESQGVSQARSIQILMTSPGPNPGRPQMEVALLYPPSKITRLQWMQNGQHLTNNMMLYNVNYKSIQSRIRWSAARRTLLRNACSSSKDGRCKNLHMDASGQLVQNLNSSIRFGHHHLVSPLQTRRRGLERDEAVVKQACM